MWSLNMYFFFLKQQLRKGGDFFGMKFNFLFKQMDINPLKPYSDFKSLFIAV